MPPFKVVGSNKKNSWGCGRDDGKGNGYAYGKGYSGTGTGDGEIEGHGYGCGNTVVDEDIAYICDSDGWGDGFREYTDAWSSDDADGYGYGNSDYYREEHFGSDVGGYGGGKSTPDKRTNSRRL